MRKIPVKNYVIALIISLLTVVLVINLMNKYNSKPNKIDFINEIKEDELNYYIAENSDTIIYMTNNKASKEINRKLKKYLKNKEIDIIYVDLNEVSNNFENEFKNKYYPKNLSSSFDISDPTIILIKDGMISKNISKIKNFTDIKTFIEGSNIK